MHSDLKPDNILVREDGEHFTARLIDFGSAFSFDFPETLGMATPESAACFWIGFCNRSEH